MILLTTTGHTS